MSANGVPADFPTSSEGASWWLHSSPTFDILIPNSIVLVNVSWYPLWFYIFLVTNNCEPSRRLGGHLHNLFCKISHFPVFYGKPISSLLFYRNSYLFCMWTAVQYLQWGAGRPALWGEGKIAFLHLPISMVLKLPPWPVSGYWQFHN